MGISSPAPDIYTKTACRTLGFTDRTAGFWAHSLLNWLTTPLMTPRLVTLSTRAGKQAYQYSLNKKLKKN